MQSTLDPASLRRLHVAIIMDGNGRWAAARGRPRTSGHRAGARAVRRAVEAAVELGLGTLTLYAFSSDNWKRPASEVSTLMRLFREYLRGQAARCLEHDVRLVVIGRRDRLPAEIVEAVDAAERTTAHGRGLLLRLAVDYSARDAILDAAARFDAPATGDARREAFARLLDAAHPDSGPVPDVDLLVRTGGEKRLSDFLLWECAYAELSFLPVMWPDFTRAHLEAALAEFSERERRFGAIPRAAIG
jgi:undecaprenyl diphosphate synthase